MKLRQIALIRWVTVILALPRTKLTAVMDYRPFACTFIAIVFCMGPSTLQSAASQITRIGDPVYKPVGFTPFAVDDSSDLLDTWKAILPEPNHVHIGPTKLPGQPHQGPYDTELSEGVAAAGHLITDVFTVEEFTSGMTIYAYSLVPTSHAPNGRSPDFSDGPVIPNEILPITITMNVLKDGNPIFDDSGISVVESLSSYDQMRLDNGQTTEFAGLNWSHMPLFPFVNNSSGSGQYEWTMNMQDVTGNGWDFRLPFTVVDEPSGIWGDLNHDGQLEIGDIDLLTRNIAAGTTSPKVDLNNDQVASFEDLVTWTEINPALFGDANLDGSVDAADLNSLALSWQQDVPLWSAGDFTADGSVNAADLNALALNWQQSIPLAASMDAPVPEPSSLPLVTLGILLVSQLFRHKRV